VRRRRRRRRRRARGERNLIGRGLLGMTCTMAISRL